MSGFTLDKRTTPKIGAPARAQDPILYAMLTLVVVVLIGGVVSLLANAPTLSLVPSLIPVLLVGAFENPTYSLFSPQNASEPIPSRARLRRCSVAGVLYLAGGLVYSLGAPRNFVISAPVLSLAMVLFALRMAWIRRQLEVAVDRNT